MGIGTSVPSIGVLTEYSQLPYLTAIWRYNGAAAHTLTDCTLLGQAAKNTITPSFTLADVNNAVTVFYGAQTRFDSLIFELSGSNTLTNIHYYIWNGTAWTEIMPRVGFDFSKTGGEHFVNLTYWQPMVLTTTDPLTVDSVPDSNARYWLKMTATAASSTSTMVRIRCNPYARYTTPNKVSALLQVPEFTNSTVPTYAQVEDLIHRKEDKIDYRTKKAWRYCFVLGEQHEFNLTGFRLTRKDIIAVTSLQIWDGSSMETRAQARNEDYFVTPALGMVYFSRYFLLPARLAFTGPHWWGWGVGEFTYAVSVDYIYGRDLETDGQGYIIEDIATKMVARDIYMTHDYSVLAPGGSDRIQLESKIQHWDDEIEETLESLRSWEVL